MANVTYIRPYLTGWSIGTYLPSAYSAPELGIAVLQGEVTGHPDIEDGLFITTSKLVAIDIEKSIARTSSRIYDLGSPDPEFVEFLEKRGSALKDYEQALGQKVE